MRGLCNKQGFISNLAIDSIQSPHMCIHVHVHAETSVSSQFRG